MRCHTFASLCMGFVPLAPRTVPDRLARMHEHAPQVQMVYFQFVALMSPGKGTSKKSHAFILSSRTLFASLRNGSTSVQSLTNSFIRVARQGRSNKVALPKFASPVFNHLRTIFVHSFALFCIPKMAMSLFSIVCALFRQNHPGWGVGT